VIGRAWAAVITLAVCGTVLIAQRTPRDASTDSYRREQKVTVFSPGALVGEFRADASRAGRTHGGRLVEVDGTVQSIGRTPAGMGYVAFLPDSSLVALFDAQNEREIQALRTSQRARIRGVVSGFARNVVTLEHSLVMGSSNR
jgi:hypothetical protein